ncbi:hypothetical protein [uncultured Jatrophihabitans sp.]
MNWFDADGVRVEVVAVAFARPSATVYNLNIQDLHTHDMLCGAQ